MKPLRPMDYKSFYEKVGELNGWDFSNVRKVSEGVAWNYEQEVTSRCKPSDALLDIGTGGGEFLLGIADYARQLVGIDQAGGMVDTASRRAKASGRLNVQFVLMDAERLAFPDRSFDVVCCRHSPFNADEVARVLKPNGVFLTQQVSEGDKRNLAEAFGRGQSDAPSGDLMRRYIRELGAAGFTDVQAQQYDATEYYAAVEDLIFLLKHTPIIPGFGEIDGDFEALARFIAAHGTARGIRTNAERFLIVARK